MQGCSVHHISLKEDAAVAAELQRAASKHVVRERDALIPAVAHLDKCRPARCPTFTARAARDFWESEHASKASECI